MDAYYCIYTIILRTDGPALAFDVPYGFCGRALEKTKVWSHLAPGSGFELPGADPGLPGADSGLSGADSGLPGADSGLPGADSKVPGADSELPELDFALQ